MKKPLKITLISLSSLIGLIIIAVVIVLTMVLTPKRLTSLVNKYAKEFITCDYNIGKVDLTVFKTFPDIGVEIDNLKLINKVEGCKNDTLAAIDNCIVALNIKELLRNKNVVVNKAYLDGGVINVFTNGDDTSNYDIFKTGGSDNQDEETSQDSTSYKIFLDLLRFSNINITYTDLRQKTDANIKGLDIKLKLKMDDDATDGNFKISIDQLAGKMDDDSSSMAASITNIGIEGDVKLDDNVGGNAIIKTGDLAFDMSGSNNINVNVGRLVIDAKGTMQDNDFIKSNLIFDAGDLSMKMNGEPYTDSLNVGFNIPSTLVLSSKNIALGRSTLKIDDNTFDISGDVALSDSIIGMNVDLATNVMKVGKLIKLIPNAIIGDALDGIDADGDLQLTANINGDYGNNMMPVVTSDIIFNNGTVVMNDVLPYPVRDINTSIHANVNLNDKTDIRINNFKSEMNNSSVSANGLIKNILGNPYTDVELAAKIESEDIKSFMPDSILVDGLFTANISLNGDIKKIMERDIAESKIDAKIICDSLRLNCYDTINAASNHLCIYVAYPRHTEIDNYNGFFQIGLSGTDITADITNMMYANMDDFDIKGSISNILVDSSRPSGIAEIAFSHLIFNMDDIHLDAGESSCSTSLLKSVNEGNQAIALTYKSDSLYYSMDGLEIATDSIAMKADFDHDKRYDLPLMRWNPKLDINLTNAVMNTISLDETVTVPSISMRYDDDGLDIKESKVILGSSDFELSGTMTNLTNSIKYNDVVRGEFNFTSDYTNITELLNLFSGKGSTDTVAEQTVAVDTTEKKEEPFMVPVGTDIKLHTMINTATFDNLEVMNVGGDFTVKDGNFILQQVGFTTDAARMELTAIYKSPRTNNLYLGFDFHLLDIDIAEMINLIPDIDTIVPMLKSFAGKAEFHLAAETNLKSDYSIKYSTLKAACSIEGSDLVVLDSETFSKIKRMLMFDKNTTNKIDSLDVQFTLFRNEIDVYPFVVSMDKYKVALYGRHNLDMSFDYNFSVLSPVILDKLGLEVKGPDFDNMEYHLKKGKIKNIYIPEKRDYVEEKIMELKKIISQSLKENLQH